MNVVMGEKVILTNPIDKLKSVGAVFEIANIVDNYIVLRDAKTKVAVGICNIVDMDFHFKKFENFTGNKWTSWTNILDETGNIIGFYRTNGKKVQVRSFESNFRGEASCNKTDTFDAWFGLRLAWERMQSKIIANHKKQCETAIKDTVTAEHNNKNNIKRLLNSLEAI